MGAPRHHGERAERAGGQPPLTAVVVPHADRGHGLDIARALAAAGRTVVMHSAVASESIAEAMDEILARGGRAAAIQSDLSDPSHPSALFMGMTRFVGPVTCVVLEPEPPVPPRDGGAAHHAGWPADLEPAGETIRWARALAAALPGDCRGRVVGVVPAAWRGDPAMAVAVAAWEGALIGLRRELEARRVRIEVVSMGEGGRASRAELDPIAAVRRVAELASGDRRQDCAVDRATESPEPPAARRPGMRPAPRFSGRGGAGVA